MDRAPRSMPPTAARILLRPEGPLVAVIRRRHHLLLRPYRRIFLGVVRQRQYRLHIHRLFRRVLVGHDGRRKW